MSYPAWTALYRGIGRQHPIYGWQLVQVKPCREVPGAVFIEMASGDRAHPGSVHLGVSVDQDAMHHLLDCAVQHVPGYLEDEPEYADDPLHPVLECVG